MNAEQASKYIGLPWKIDGNGPEAWNCWNLARYILLKYFDKEIPFVDLESDDVPALYREKMDQGSWVVREKPEHGFGVLLKGGMHPHVGVFLDIDGGGVLHSLEGAGVVFTPLSALRMLGFGNVKFYEVVK